MRYSEVKILFANELYMCFITIKELPIVRVGLLLLLYVKFILNCMFNKFYYIIYMIIKRSYNIPHINLKLMILYFIMVGRNQQIYK